MATYAYCKSNFTSICFSPSCSLAGAAGEEFEKLDLLQYSKDYYRKRGTGRPTKKDRRDIDDYYESPEQ